MEAMWVELHEGEMAMLLQAMPPGEQHAIKFGFGPGGAFLNVEQHPEAAQLLLEYREERAGILVSDGGGI